MSPRVRKSLDEKVCNLCGRHLPASEFYSQKTSAGSTVLRSRCKDCYREVTRDYYQLNREELLQRQRQQYKKRRSYLLNYYRSHREERLKYQREWYRKRKALLAEYAEKLAAQQKKAKRVAAKSKTAKKGAKTKKTARKTGR